MQWPVDRIVYDDPIFLEIVQRCIANLANTIAEFEPVLMLAGKSHHANARALLSEKVELWNIETNDLWCRDSGPLFARNQAGKRFVCDIQFNGWGQRQPHEQDAKISREIAIALGMERIPTGLRGEPGGVEHDGHGLLVAHESSWVHDNRNPGMSRDDIEKRLLAAYGAKEIIWSNGVRDQDITDYHIDSLARFTAPSRMLMNLPSTPDLEDPFHRAALETSRKIKDAGVDVEVISEPEIRRVKHSDFVASYANFYLCNGSVIAAEYGDQDADKSAKDALARHFPDREIIMLDVDPLGEIGGGIHCATAQMPAI